MENEALKLILNKNPGLLNILLTGVLLPLGILLLTNRNNRKQKNSEKSLDIKFNSKENLRHQQSMVFSSLIKVLFDVQQLHTNLSVSLFNQNNSIQTSVSKFEESVSKYHCDISNNMLYLSSTVINLVYKFFNQTRELNFELREIASLKDFNMTPVSVYYHAKVLAATAIEIQELFIKELSNLKIHFDKSQQEMMKNFCGSEPPEDFRNKYQQLKKILSENKILHT